MAATPAEAPVSTMRLPVWRLADKTQVGTVQVRQDVFGISETAVRKDILHTVVVWQRAKRRQAPAFAKTRAEVTGSGRKIYRQKGTGRARHGDRYAPIFVGGGKAHGPRPRSFEYAIPKKIRRMGLIHALSWKHSMGNLVVVDSFATESMRQPSAASTEYLKTQQVLHTFRQWGLCQHGPVNFPLASADCVQRIPEIKMPVRSADVWEESSLPENLTVPEVLDGGKTTVNSVLLIGSLEQLTDDLRRSISNLGSVDCLPVEGVNVYSLLRSDFVVVTEEAMALLEERVCRPINRRGCLFQEPLVSKEEILASN